MSLFNRMKTSWFPPQAEADRKPRVATKAAPATTLNPAHDERTAFAAAEIIENHSFSRVMSRLKAEAVQGFSSSLPGVNGTYDRERAHMKMTILEEIETSIQAMADDLKLHRRKSPEN